MELRSTPQPASTPQWICSTADRLWVHRTAELQTATALAEPTLRLNGLIPKQTIDGFGGCFNELGWHAMQPLNAQQRTDILQALFGDDGCRFDICRMPIGASDYALDYYSLDDTTDDLGLEHFSLDRDRQLLLPFIKSAMEVRPQLKVWGSPWTPPAWMKSNRDYKEQGHDTHGLRWERPVLNAYAEYLAKAAIAFRAEGLNFYALHMQNEVVAAQIFPSCVWTGEHIREFIRDFLGPCFDRHKLDVEIWLGTVNSADYKGLIAPTLIDPVTAAYVRGVGLQWDGKNGINGLHAEFPKVKIMQTETECGGGQNDWEYADYTFSLMKLYFEAGVSAYMQWNMVLDETGNSRWGWKQCAMVSVDQKTLDVRYNPQFYLVKHVAHFVHPGAQFLAADKHPGTLAFRNPDGRTILLQQNSSPSSQMLYVEHLTGTLQAELPARSFNTFVI